MPAPLLPHLFSTSQTGLCLSLPQKRQPLERSPITSTLLNPVFNYQQPWQEFDTALLSCLNIHHLLDIEDNHTSHYSFLVHLANSSSSSYPISSAPVFVLFLFSNLSLTLSVSCSPKALNLNYMLMTSKLISSVQTYFPKSRLRYLKVHQTPPLGCWEWLFQIHMSQTVLTHKTCIFHNLLHLNLLQLYHSRGSGRKPGIQGWPLLCFIPNTWSIRKSCWLYFQNIYRIEFLLTTPAATLMSKLLSSFNWTTAMASGNNPGNEGRTMSISSLVHFDGAAISSGCPKRF